MIKQLTFLAVLASLTSQAMAADPVIPDEIKALAGENVVLHAFAKGSQVYVCQDSGDGKAQWTLRAPEADLKDAKGAVIGKHFFGPTWKLNDGSQITARPAAK